MKAKKSELNNNPCSRYHKWPNHPVERCEVSGRVPGIGRKWIAVKRCVIPLYLIRSLAERSVGVELLSLVLAKLAPDALNRPAGVNRSLTYHSTVLTVLN